MMIVLGGHCQDHCDHRHHRHNDNNIIIHTMSSTVLLTTTKTCLICGARAINHNFGGLSCESCKVFFRRTALKAKRYVCKHDNNCRLTSGGRKCIACRLSKCYEAGMRKEFINLKIAKTATTTNDNKKNLEVLPAITTSPAVFCLTRYEQKCLAEIEASSQIFPDERAIYARGNVSSVDHHVECANHAVVYLKPMIKYCNSFEPFRSLEHYHQVQLLKTFFDYFLTIRGTFNLLPGGFDFPMLGDEQGQKCYLVNWKKMMDQMDPTGVIIPKCIKAMDAILKALDQDSMTRDILSVMLLFQAPPSMSCYQYLRYHNLFYATLLKRYLLVRHQNVAAAREQYRQVVALVALCKEIRTYSDVMIQAMDPNDFTGMSHIVMELYEL